MEITALGHSSFKLKGKQTTIVTDPFIKEAVGFKFPSVYADAVTVSHDHQDHNNVEAIQGTPVVIYGPGEYEIKGVRIIGVGSYHDGVKGAERGKNTIFHLEVDGIKIVHCGDLGHLLDDKQIEPLGDVEILILPVGGIFTITAHQAAQLVAKIEPVITIPMHYKTANHDQTKFEKLSPVADFLKEMGKEAGNLQPKITVSRDRLPAEPTVIVMQ